MLLHIAGIEDRKTKTQGEYLHTETNNPTSFGGCLEIDFPDELDHLTTFL